MLLSGLLSGFVMIALSVVTLFANVGIQSKSRDTERMADIKALHRQLEAYFAENNRYPTLQNMNDSRWRATNMRGLDEEALRDPNGSSKILTPTPTKNVYAYKVMTSLGADCNNTSRECSAYQLTATLENSGPYVKLSLN